jgi:hypothetical protein
LENEMGAVVDDSLPIELAPVVEVLTRDEKGSGLNLLSTGEVFAAAAAAVLARPGS